MPSTDSISQQWSSGVGWWWRMVAVNQPYKYRIKLGRTVGLCILLVWKNLCPSGRRIPRRAGARNLGILV